MPEIQSNSNHMTQTRSQFSETVLTKKDRNICPHNIFNVSKQTAFMQCSTLEITNWIPRHFSLTVYTKKHEQEIVFLIPWHSLKSTLFKSVFSPIYSGQLHCKWVSNIFTHQQSFHTCWAMILHWLVWGKLSGTMKTINTEKK